MHTNKQKPDLDKENLSEVSPKKSSNKANESQQLYFDYEPEIKPWNLIWVVLEIILFIIFVCVLLNYLESMAKTRLKGISKGEISFFKIREQNMLFMNFNDEDDKKKTKKKAPVKNKAKKATKKTTSKKKQVRKPAAKKKPLKKNERTYNIEKYKPELIIPDEEDDFDFDEESEYTKDLPKLSNEECFIVDGLPPETVGPRQTFHITSNPFTQAEAPHRIERALQNKKEVHVYFCAPQRESFIKKILRIVTDWMKD